MSMYDPISIALEIEPIKIEKYDLQEDKKNSIQTGINNFPAGVHGTQDHSFMQTPEHRLKKSIITKKSWENSLDRKIKARKTIQQSTRKRVYAEGIIFESLTSCAKHYNVTLEAVRAWMRKGKDFYYI